MGTLLLLWAQLSGLLQAIGYTLMHPFEAVHLTIVRRYADAQGNFIGELYERFEYGHATESGAGWRMIGASCDNWPLDADVSPIPMHPKVCWSRSFLEALPQNTLRVGAMEPQDNADVQAYVARRRFLPLRVTVLNRFVEHVMEDKSPKEIR